MGVAVEANLQTLLDRLVQFFYSQIFFENSRDRGDFEFFRFEIFIIQPFVELFLVKHGRLLWLLEIDDGEVSRWLGVWFFGKQALQV